MAANPRGFSSTSRVTVVVVVNDSLEGQSQLISFKIVDLGKKAGFPVKILECDIVSLVKMNYKDRKDSGS